MQFTQLLDTLARSSAQAVTTLSQRQEEKDELKKYLYVKADIEEDFLALLESDLSAGSVVFLCGSSGDGKSELLSRHYDTYSKRFRFYLDATHSFKPDQTAVEALDQLFDEHQQSQQPLVVGINVGMLLNYRNTAAERHADIKVAIDSFIDGKRSLDSYQFISFEDYPKFSLESGAVGSEFVEELLQKVTAPNDKNPIFRAYQALDIQDPRLECHNYRLLQEPEVQKVIVRTLLHARLKFDQFFSTRTLLDLIHHLTSNNDVLFNNLFASPGYGLAGTLVDLDPCLLRSQKLDQFLIQQSLNISDSEFEQFKQEYFEKYGRQELSPSCWVRAFYTLQNVDLGNNYHKNFSKDFAQPLFDEYIRVWQLHLSEDSKDRKDLRDFYNKQLITSLLKFANRLEPKLINDGIYLTKRNDVVISAKINVRPDLHSIAKANSKKNQIHCFYAAIKVDDTPLKPFPVTISFLELAKRILGGYRPNRHDKNAVVILEEVIEELVSTANKAESIYLHRKDKKWILSLDDGDFIVEAE